MKILSIETSGKICAVALFNNNNLIDEIILEDENTHSVKLMPIIDQILKRTNIKVQDIDLFACDCGPGSFTGIRIGISTIKGFVDATNKNAVGVSSLENLAYNIKENGIICSLIDAKNDNVYFGLFEKKEEEITKLREYKFDSLENIITELENIKEKIIFIGDGAINYKQYIIEKLYGKCDVKLESNLNKLNARNIAIAAYNKLNINDISDIRPLYLRKSNAERQLEDKNGNNN